MSNPTAQSTNSVSSPDTALYAFKPLCLRAPLGAGAFHTHLPPCLDSRPRHWTVCGRAYPHCCKEVWRPTHMHGLCKQTSAWSPTCGLSSPLSAPLAVSELPSDLPGCKFLEDRNDCFIILSAPHRTSSTAGDKINSPFSSCLASGGAKCVTVVWSRLIEDRWLLSPGWRYLIYAYAPHLLEFFQT